MRTPFILILMLAGIAPTLAAERTDKIFIQGNPAGTQTVKEESSGAVRVEYSYNDRGRGDHIIATWKLDAAGVPIEYEGSGNDYMKAPVEERFEMKNGQRELEESQRTRRAGRDRRSVLFADKRAAGVLRGPRACPAESAQPQAASSAGG